MARRTAEEEREIRAKIKERLEGGSEAAWDELWNAFEEVEGAASFGSWEGGEPVTIDGEEFPTCRWFLYSPAVDRMLEALWDLDLVIPPAWENGDEDEHYIGGVGMAEAPVEDALRMIGAILNTERFCEGLINGLLEDGTLQAAVARVRSWKASHR